MNFKPFFVHHRPSFVWKNAPKAFTAWVRPAHEEGMIAVSIALCHPKDQFCKKEGRSQAMQRQPDIIRARDLAPYLEVYRGDLCGYDGMEYFFSGLGKVHNFEYLYKYMV